MRAPPQVQRAGDRAERVRALERMGLAAEHDHPACAGLADQALHQAALPDARLAVDQQHRRLPGPHITHHAPDQIQLEIPSYQAVCGCAPTTRIYRPHLTQGFPGQANILGRHQARQRLWRSGPDMPARKRPTPQDAVTASQILLDWLAPASPRRRGIRVPRPAGTLASLAHPGPRPG